MKLINETEYQNKIAMIPMEERTFVKAWQTAQEMPTVEAIPIEWINNWAKENYYDEQGLPLLFQKLCRLAIISHMIADWEKENDRIL